MLLHDESPAAVEEREKAFLLGTYARTPFHPRSGKGSRIIDADGREYWDLLGGIAVNVLGHRHPRLIKALRDESNALLHISNLYYHPAQGLLAERLVRASGLCRAFFCNSGTEANEAALKFARLANPGRAGIVALNESFHGRTMGSLAITGHEAYRAPFEPLIPGVTFIEPNDIVALEAAVNESTCAIFLEPIMGEGGIIPLSHDFLAAARRVADRTGAILIFDEIQCGLGRTGTLFAFQQSGIVPDIVTLAKPLGGGLPLGAVLTGAAIEGVVKPGHHGTTFGGNPVACRLGLAVLDEIEESNLLDRITSIGNWFNTQLLLLQSRNRSIVDIRGQGFMWGIELDDPAKPVVAELLAKGFICGTARDNVIRLLPPYVTPKKAFVEFIDALEQALENRDEGKGTRDDLAASPSSLVPPRRTKGSAMRTFKKVALAYSGGLDTSIIIPWLKENYGCEVVAVAVDVGQAEETAGLAEKAYRTGACDFHLIDAKEEFARDFLFPVLKAGAIYEKDYLLGTSTARPLIARKQVEIALATGCDALAHGCTGKGNDQVRFELAYQALAPELAVIAPWREWDIVSREDAIDYASSRGIPVPVTKKDPYSRDRNLWHLSHEGGPLEDPSFEPEASMFKLTVDPMAAPDAPEKVAITFEGGVPVAVNGAVMSPAAIVIALNEIGGRNGVGRVDLVENRLVGIKSRGVYETPGGTLLVTALKALESITLDRDSAHEKERIATRYAELVYFGQWFSPLKEAFDAFVDSITANVSGTITLKLYKGNTTIIGRTSPNSLYSEELASFNMTGYDARDAAGFIRVFGLPTRGRNRIAVDKNLDDTLPADEVTAARLRKAAG